MDVNCLFYISFHFITHLFFGRDNIVQVIFVKPLKTLILLCRGNLSGTAVIVHICCSKPLKALMLWYRGSVFSFQFLDGKQNLVPNMWQVVFANVPVEGKAVDSDVNGFFDGSDHTMSLPCYNLEVFH